MISHHHLGESLRHLKRRIRVARRGFHEYKGSDTEICKTIVTDCYDAKEHYYRTSTGNFAEFWMRDFGLTCASLLKLGRKEEVHRTLQYALSCYSREGKITTQITPRGIPIDTFDMAVDSFPFLTRSILTAGAFDLAEAYRPFFEHYAIRYKDQVFDRSRGLVKRGYFSSIKDGFVRDSSCYDNCCLAMLKADLTRLHLKNPFLKDDLEGNIAKHFWKGDHFIDDLSGRDQVSGDANVFPFFLGIFEDKRMRRSAIAALRKNGLDRPLPLRYTTTHPPGELWYHRVFAPGYEGKTVWLHLGLAYLAMVAKEDKKLLRDYLSQYRDIILRYKTFPEVLDEDQKPYRSPFYSCDEGMLWAANYLTLSSQV